MASSVVGPPRLWYGDTAPDEHGCFFLDTSGANPRLKVQIAGEGSGGGPVSILTGLTVAGSYLGTTVVTATGTFTTQASTTKIRVRIVAAGGGGGGAASVAVSAASAGGGSAGGYVEGEFTVAGSTGYAVTIGSAGVAGTSAGGNGGTASDSQIVVGATIMKAKGGIGGTGDTGGTSVLISAGGASPGVSLNGDMNCSGAPGEYGTRLTGLIGASGDGGSSQFGPGGGGLAAAGAGVTPVGYGGGGGGGLVINGSAGVTGGVGGPAVCVIAEYA